MLAIKKIFTRLIIRLVNQIDFSALAGKIAGSRFGQPVHEKFSNLPPSWENSEQVRDLAVQSTLDQLKAEGHDADPEDIQALIREIEIKYDHATHIKAATAFSVIFDQIFTHQNSDLPFTSLNKRDLAHINTLREYRQKGLGVVYLINHSSHMDEFIFNVLWQHLGLGLPVFAAGQNMMAIKSIAKLLMIGSYVVLRQGASRFQMAALYNYCRAISMAGQQQGIFLEAWRGGARSRDGSLRYPKRLVTLRGAIDVEQDLVIQPVALSFSAVPEDLPLAARKSGVSWIRGIRLSKLLLYTILFPKSFIFRTMKDLYGRAYISVPEPFLLSELKTRHSEDKSGVQLDEYVALSSIRRIAQHKKILASQIAALGLLKARKETDLDLKSSIARQIQNTREYHLQNFGTPADFEDFILWNSVDHVMKDGLKTLAKRGVIRRWLKDKKGLPQVRSEAGLAFYATHADRRLYSPTADQNIVVVGAGHWGFALACLVGNRILEDRTYANASLTIFDPRPGVADEMSLNRNGPGPFANALLPKNAFVTNDFSSAFRKASEIIIALKPDDFAPTFEQILAVAEQPLKIILATRGFISEHHAIPYLAAQTLLRESGRYDVKLYTLCGPVSPKDLVTATEIKGILAGTDSHVEALSDLFNLPFVESHSLDDPIGVQTADILARIYAIWISYADASGLSATPTQTAFLMTDASREVSAFAIKTGADPKSFEAGSIAWAATFYSLCSHGLWKDFGERIGSSVKKGKNPHAVFSKVREHYEKEGLKIHAVDDMMPVLNRARQYQLDMPILEQAIRTFFNP